MEKKLVIFAMAFLMLSVASAEIIIHQQPDEVYNLGDSIPFSMSAKPQTDFSGHFIVNLICEGTYKEVGKIPLTLKTLEEQRIEFSIGLTQAIIGNLNGLCYIKGSFGSEQEDTNEFEISKSLTINLKEYPEEISPEESFVVKGGAVKANGEDVNGFVNVNFGEGNGSLITQLETIKNGFFSANITIPDDLMAGTYLVTLNAYEKDANNEITNNGITSFNIYVKQIPKNLEIVVENSEVEPGENLNVKTILHDQTGQNIETMSIITLKNSKGKIIEQVEKDTDEIYEFLIEKNELPVNWSIHAVSRKLEAEGKFKILEKADVEVELINDTIVIKNVGNVFYNESVFVNIGEEKLEIETALDVGEEQKYLLKAPDGEYSVEIIAEGESTTEEGVLLTGRAIDIKEGRSSKAFIARPIVGIFLIVIICAIAFIIFRKGIKRTFVGKFHFKKKDKLVPIMNGSKIKTEVKNDLISPKNKAEVSLSIVGKKQEASIVCLKLKNYKDISSGTGGVKETLSKVVDVGDKTFVYDNGENIFFILAPSVTKTFKNEMPAVNLAKKIDSLLKDHNRLFKQRIDYGIALNFGEIISKVEKNDMKFMSVGRTITNAKKLAGISGGDVLLSPEINKKFGSKVKTKKHVHEDVEYYKITEIIDTSKSKTFIEGFLKRNFE